MMHVGGQTGAFPPIGGLYLEYKVTHTHMHSTSTWRLRLDY